VHPGRIGNRIDGAPVVAPEQLAGRPPGRLVASVAGADARLQIRQFLLGIGWVDGRHFVVAA
jgi:hypothetical protein